MKMMSFYLAPTLYQVSTLSPTINSLCKNDVINLPLDGDLQFPNSNRSVLYNLRIPLGSYYTYPPKATNYTLRTRELGSYYKSFTVSVVLHSQHSPNLQ